MGERRGYSTLLAYSLAAVPAAAAGSELLSKGTTGQQVILIIDLEHSMQPAGRLSNSLL